MFDNAIDANNSLLKTGRKSPKYRDICLTVTKKWKNRKQEIDQPEIELGLTLEENPTTTGYPCHLSQVDPGGPVVIILTSGSEVRGFDPGRGRWIFQIVKIVSMTSFGREVKPCVLCHRFTTRNRTSS